MGLPGSSLTRTYQRLAAELIGLALFVIVAMAISIRLRLFAQWVNFVTQIPGLDNDEFGMLPVVLAAAFAVFAVQRWQQFKLTANRLAALTRAAQIISSTLDPDQVTGKIVEAARDIMGYSHIAVMSVHGEGLTATVWSGYEGNPPELTINQGITGRVARTGSPAYVVDVSKDPDFVPGVGNTTSEIAHPIVVDGRIAGVLNVESVGGRRLTPEDADLIGTLAIQIGIALRNASVHAATREQALRDGLTGLYDHAAFHERLRDEVTRAQRYGRPLAVVIADLDDFKQVNDHHGHLEGDQVLRLFADVIRSVIRTEDLAARYGGEEFSIIMPETGAQGAARAAERIRERFAKQRMTIGGVSLSCTASFGVAAMPEYPGRSETLLQAADAALYEAKHQGKNRVQVAAPAGGGPV